MFFKKKVKKDDSYGAFVNGVVMGLEAMPDQVFSQKLMGDGFAIEPTDGIVVAPTAGDVTVVFPTGHAYGITREDGVEVLIHLGVDTVELGGEGFEAKVSVGDKVKRGDVICHMDLEKIREHGKPTISAFILTSGEKINLLRNNETVTVETNDIISF